MTKEQANERLAELHREVDARAAEIEANLPGKLACRAGCADCCLDDLTAFTIETDLIREIHGDLLNAAEPHPKGACAFLDSDGACRVYAQRPYVCRTQGLPLGWQAEDESGDEVEMRDICPLNEEPLGVPLQELTADQCWPLGTFEGRLASLQAEYLGEFELKREALRDLFGENVAKF